MNTLAAQLDSLNTSRSLDTTLALLQTAAAQADEASEATADQFVRGGPNADVDAFLTRFMADRQLAHSRKVRAEKLADTLRQQRYTSGGHQQQQQQSTTSWTMPGQPQHHQMPYGIMPIPQKAPGSGHHPPPPPTAYYPTSTGGGGAYPHLPTYR